MATKKVKRKASTAPAKKRADSETKIAVAAVDSDLEPPAPAKKGRAKRTKPEAVPERPVYPMRVLPPLPPELTGALPAGMAFPDLAVGASFRYRIAVERGVNEVWQKHDERRYGDVGAPERNWYPAPEGSLILPV